MSLNLLKRVLLLIFFNVVSPISYGIEITAEFRYEITLPSGETKTFLIRERNSMHKLPTTKDWTCGINVESSLTKEDNLTAQRGILSCSAGVNQVVKIPLVCVWVKGRPTEKSVSIHLEKTGAPDTIVSFTCKK